MIPVFELQYYYNIARAHTCFVKFSKHIYNVLYHSNMMMYMYIRTKYMNNTNLFELTILGVSFYEIAYFSVESAVPDL